MKRFARRLFVTLLLLFYISSLVGAAFLPLQSTLLPLAPGAALRDALLREDLTGSVRNERVLTVEPGRDAKMHVVYGSTLYGETTMDVMEQYPDAWGFSVLAGVNGSFFDVGTGIPYGCVITDGAVRSSGDLEAVGFRADGSAVFGKPELAIRLVFPDGTEMTCHCNKTLSKSNGFVLYTRDYDSRTKNTTDAYNVLLLPDQPDLLLGTEISATVTGAREGASCDIPAGGFVLSMAKGTDYPASLQNLLMPLKEGDALTIRVEIGEAWRDVVCACGGMEMLVEGGAAKTAFQLSSARTRTSRTAIGAREDGTVVLYTADSAGGSTGMTLFELAEKMASLGCVDALNLDGGGSTAIRALLPGTRQTQTINTPSDGKLRRCANFLFLLREKAAAGEAARLFAYPYRAFLLPCGSVELTVTATDEAFVAADVPEDLTVTAENGWIDAPCVFTAQAPGTAKIALSSQTAEGSLELTVLETPDSISVLREADGTAGGGEIVCNQTLALTATARYAGQRVFCSDKSFIWSCDSAVGTIDETGLFTPVKTYTPVQGEIRCAAGACESRVALTVLPDYPFADTEYHWAREQVRTMYDAGVLKGSLVGGVPCFRPDDNMTRQEFLTALVRSLGAETAAYDDAALPFADAEQIADWALPAIRASYALGYLNGSLRGDALYALPGASISRQEAMTVLSRTLPQEESAPQGDPLAVFPDAGQVAGWAREGLSRMVEKGIISGMNGELRPLEPVTRAQVAKLLASLAR